jgi:cytochrome c
MRRGRRAARAAAIFVAAVPVPGGAQDTGAAAPAATVAVSRGERLFLQCRACHTLRRGEPHTVGPNLAGFFDRAAATADGYAYSAALRQASLVWHEATLDRWLASPSTLVPGTSMAFVGLADADQRGALIAWLRTASAN